MLLYLKFASCFVLLVQFVVSWSFFSQWQASLDVCRMSIPKSALQIVPLSLFCFTSIWMVRFSSSLMRVSLHLFFRKPVVVPDYSCNCFFCQLFLAAIVLTQTKTCCCYSTCISHACIWKQRARYHSQTTQRTARAHPPTINFNIRGTLDETQIRILYRSTFISAVNLNACIASCFRRPFANSRVAYVKVVMFIQSRLSFFDGIVIHTTPSVILSADA